MLSFRKTTNGWMIFGPASEMKRGANRVTRKNGQVVVEYITEVRPIGRADWGVKGMAFGVIASKAEAAGMGNSHPDARDCACGVQHPPAHNDGCEERKALLASSDPAARASGAIKARIFGWQTCYALTPAAEALLDCRKNGEAKSRTITYDGMADRVRA